MALIKSCLAGGGALTPITTQTYTNSSYNQSSDTHVFTVPADIKCIHGELTFASIKASFTAYYDGNDFVTSTELGASINEFSFTLSGTSLTVTVRTEVIGVTSITIDIDGAV